MAARQWSGASGRHGVNPYDASMGKQSSLTVGEACDSACYVVTNTDWCQHDVVDKMYII